MDGRENLTQRISANLQKVEQASARLRKTQTTLLIASVFCSAATTLVSGITAAQGPVVGDGPDGWKLSCLIAAIFGFLTTVTIGLSQQLKLNDRLLDSKECLGKLRALDLRTVTSEWDEQEVGKELADVLKQHSGAIG